MLRFIKCLCDPNTGEIVHVREAGTPEELDYMTPGSVRRPDLIEKYTSIDTDVPDLSPDCPRAHDYRHMLELPTPSNPTARLRFKAAQEIADVTARAKIARVAQEFDYTEAVQALESARARIRAEEASQADRIAALEEQLRLLQR